MKKDCISVTSTPDRLRAIVVRHVDGKRTVRCFCGQDVGRSIVPHLRQQHPEVWAEWVRTFAEMRTQGATLKRIMRAFATGEGDLLFSWTVVERAIRRAVEQENLDFKPPRKEAIVQWEPGEFILETKSVWDFPKRGDWAVHSGDYRGNWPPQLVRNVVERLTVRGDLVVDAFVGGGTTLIEAWLLGRRSVGIDISRFAYCNSLAKLAEMEKSFNASDDACLPPECKPILVRGDALELGRLLAEQGILPGGVQLVCAHPPYLDAVEYAWRNSRDLANLPNEGQFLDAIGVFGTEACRALADGGHCVVLVGDVRKGNRLVPLGFLVLDRLTRAGLELEDIVVKTQHKDRSSEFYVSKNTRHLLLAHEYLFIMSKRAMTHAGSILELSANETASGRTV